MRAHAALASTSMHADCPHALSTDSVHSAAEPARPHAPGEVLRAAGRPGEAEAGDGHTPAGCEPRPEEHQLPGGAAVAACACRAQRRWLGDPACALRACARRGRRGTASKATLRRPYVLSRPQFRTHKVIYRRYAGLFFSVCVDVGGATRRAASAPVCEQARADATVFPALQTTSWPV